VALRDNDYDGYIQLLKKEKNNRLEHIIIQTNKYLSSLGSKIKIQKEENAMKGDPDMPSEEIKDEEKEEEDDNDEDLLKESKIYASLTHTVNEEITE
jgi:hypothetical protein